MNPKPTYARIRELAEEAIDHDESWHVFCAQLEVILEFENKRRELASERH